MDESKLYKRFIIGLKDKYNLSFNDIKDWEYAGSEEHISYYKLRFPHSKKLPQKEDECVCGHWIKKNCYITDGKRILILGSCCIEKFIPKGLKRICSKCHQPHKNRIVNRCNDCRIGICDICNIKIDPKYKTCFKCKINL